MSALRVLFVCAGNTCRSPMAEDVARRLAAARGIDATFASAGLIAADGEPAAPYAIAVARSRGGDLSQHESQSLTGRLVAAHDLVLVMEPYQLDAVEALGGAGKTRLLDHPHAIDDPVLSETRDAYERTYDRLEDAIARALETAPHGAPA
jgi:protein-tyrosine-phosphatase